MKTSDQCLSTLIATLFLGSALLLTAERLFMGLEPPIAAAKVADVENGQSGDSSQAVVPGDGVKWNRVTLGLRRSLQRGIIEDSSIFRDIRLKYFNNSCITRPFFRPLGKADCCWLWFSYLKAEPDSLKGGNAEPERYHFINVHVTKHRTANGSDSIHQYLILHQAKAEERPPGVWNYRAFDGCWCEWRKGRWSTQIEVPLAVCGNDSAKAAELRDQVRDRLFAYYKNLK